MGFLSKAFKGVTNLAKSAASSFTGSDLISGGLGALSYLGGEKQNEAQIASSKDQMDFQERMSNTAHQRQIKDLRKAGLNPILSAKLGGASSPGGAMPNIVNPEAAGVSSAISAKQTSASSKLMNAQLATAQETAQGIRYQNTIDKYFASLTNTAEGRALLLRGKFGIPATAMYSAVDSAKNSAETFPFPMPDSIKGVNIIDKLKKSLGDMSGQNILDTISEKNSPRRIRGEPDYSYEKRIRAYYKKYPNRIKSDMKKEFN